MSPKMTIACAAALVLMATLASAVPAMDARFAAFKANHNRKYASAQEEQFRRSVFEMNMQRAAELQRRNPKATFGENRFADMTAEEFKTLHNGEQYFSAQRASTRAVAEVAVPQSGPKTIDWRKKGAVTPIKNQGQCGGCWAFSTTGNIEGQWFLAGHPLTSLSEQELISCDTSDSGCGGGIMNNAFQWLINNTNGVISTEAGWPFASGSGKAPSCNMDQANFGAQIYNWTALPNDEAAMASWMYENGPVSIAVDATSWQTYTGGIMTDCESKQLDHGVLIVGLEKSDGQPYWIIKNQWTASWGEKGYIYLEYGTNQCLLNQDPVSSLVNASQPTPPPSPPGPTSPFTPAPPAPPTPAGTFSQTVCSDPQCAEDCNTNTFPQNQCLNAGNFGVEAECGTEHIFLTQFTNQECTGKGTTQRLPLNTCLELENGGSETLTCGGDAVANHGLHKVRLSRG